MTAFSPGQSPPPVSTPIRIVVRPLGGLARPPEPKANPPHRAPRPSPRSATHQGRRAQRGVTSAISDQPSCGIVVLMMSGLLATDRKSTRLNSSHDQISYAVFCLKKKKN